MDENAIREVEWGEDGVEWRTEGFDLKPKFLCCHLSLCDVRGGSVMTPTISADGGELE